MKTISIIIPAFNAGRYLSATVDGVLAQTFPDWELVVVDDGSQDDTAAVAKGYAAGDDRLRVVTKPNQGVAEARNTGLLHSSRETEYVIFLDADDVWEPATLATLLSAMRDHPEAAGAHGWARYIDSSGRLISCQALDRMTRRRMAAVKTPGGRWRVRPQPLEPYTDFFMLAVQNCIVTPGAVLIRRAALAEIDPFDAATTPCEDWDLWLRLARHRPLVFVNGPVVQYRQHGSGASQSKERMHNAHFSVVTKALAWPDNTEVQRGAVQTGARYYAMAACLNRLDWARGCWRQRQFLQAAKQLRHAAMSYVDYVRDGGARPAGAPQIVSRPGEA